MAVDKNKIIAEATKLVQKGAYDKAIKAYEKILAEDAKDVRILLKIGELHQKKGDDKAAAAAFQKVAETYAEQGFFLKSVAVYKQIVKLDPDDVRANERLAALYQQLGLMSDAMAQLQTVAAAHEKAGDLGRLTEILRRMVDLDPENIASSIKLGEMQARAGHPASALECFRRAADYLKRNGRADEYLRVAERIAVLTPDDHALTRELAHVYLGKGDTKRALAKLQLCFKVDPKDVETLQLLAQAFRDLGQTAKTLSVWKELARLHEERGRAGDARAAWRKVQELAPDDADAAAALGAGWARSPAPAHPPPPAHPAATPLAFGPAFDPPPVPGRVPQGPPPGARVSPAVVAPPPAPAGVAPPPAGGPAGIPKLLTETDVYVKYGLHDKALDHLRKVLAIDPDCPEAYERIRDVHDAAGRASDAAAAGVRAARSLLARGQEERAREAVTRLGQLSPGHPELASLAAAAGGGADEVELVPLEAEELVEADPVEDDALALAAAGHEGDDVVEDEPVGPAPAREEHAGVEIEVAESELDAAGDALAEAAALASAASEEIVEEEPPRARAPAPAASAPRRDGASRSPAGRPAPAQAAAPAWTPAPVAPPPPPAARPPARAAGGDVPDLSDELEETEFFLQQGLLDDARDALHALLAAHPRHPVLEARLAEVERRAGRAAPAAAPSGARETRPLEVSGPDESFDIARELADELAGEAPPTVDDEFQYSVEDVFAQFKKGVEQTVRPEDSATHYDLGIAYKEMALLDDAIQEFEVALRGADKRRAIDCLSMVGLCRMAKGEPREAIRAFRRALASEALTKEAAKAIQYELGAAHEAVGEAEVGLWFLQRVAKLDPAFREVGARIGALGGGPGRPPADASRGARPAQAPRPPAGVKKNIGYL
ncbi:tetratricopeptide repeat protein [Anaeromyxobacter sp. Fw109-5]|uniref:tetratricopeptide repeat protein n=1 Tax=Anaeromyxobacter sp. (strain Fw109-5) TaxID=404589 RepID=UPI000158A749|nr:tetratricopeptide repeat protein [Anaeromyxobacter sp. Fw109-5]ABS24909.1 Tetratricopeptide TPR_2 repeat protein [Anaeromyxobacter sp. Fw109-5]